MSEAVFPHLRFSSYSLPWTERQIKSDMHIRRGLTYSPQNVRNHGEGIRVLRSSNIAGDQFVLRDDDIYVDKSAVNIPFAQNGDILITASNGSPRLVGKHAVVSIGQDETVVHGGFMLLAESDHGDFTNALLSAP